MIFLIVYHRERGELETLTPFDESERDQAENVRLDLELKLNRQGVGREVVLLEAETEDDLRRTHRRYFEDLADLMREPVAGD